MINYALPNADATVVTVTSTSTLLTDLINTAGSTTVEFPSVLDGVDLVVEADSVRVLFDGNVPTSTKGVLLTTGTYKFRGVNVGKCRLIRVGGSNISVGVQLGYASPNELATASAAGGGGGGGGTPGGSNDSIQYRINGTTFGGMANWSSDGTDLFGAIGAEIVFRNSDDTAFITGLRVTEIAPGVDFVNIANGSFGVIPGTGIAVLTAPAGANSLLNLDRQDSTEGAIAGEISFTALDDTSANVSYGSIRTTIIDNDNTSIDGRTDFNTISGGFEVTPLSLANGQVRLSRIPRFDAEAVTGGVAYAEFETGLDTNSFAYQFGAGTTVPGAVAGWSGSAIFTDADAVGVQRPWINLGTSSSADFRRIATFTSAGVMEALGNGTAGSPALTFSGDNDTGFYILAANNLAATTAGVVRTNTNASGFYTVGSGSTTEAVLGMGNSQATGFSAGGGNINTLISGVTRAAVTPLGAINLFVGGAGVAGDVAVGRDTTGGIFLNALSGGNVELRTNGTTRLTIASASTIIAALPFTFGASTAPTAGSRGFGRSGTTLAYNVPSGETHVFTVNGVTNVTFGANTIGFNGASPVAQSTAIANATGGATVDAEARTAINTLLAYLRTRGDIAT